jgi:uncharacterized membrane protein YqjE
MKSDEPEIERAAPIEPGWRERLWAVGAAAGRLLETRKVIFQEELAEKGGLLGKAFVGIFLALLFAILAGLLLTALLAAVFSKLLGSSILGILATLVLYVGVAALAGWIGVKKLSVVRPFEFPATRREIDRDLEAVKKAARVGQPRTEEKPEPTGPPAPGGGTFRRDASEETAREIEARLREGAG